MKERTTVMIIVSILLLSGILVYYLQFNFSDFNFYKSELTINENQIQEKLSYLTDKDYHTLYRGFQSFVSATGKDYPNSVWIKNVLCGEGNPYFNTPAECYNNNFSIPSSCLLYTEPNEYGCSFGDVYGFKEGKNYWIEADYELKPTNLIRIDNNYYIKFVAYNENAHKKLVVRENLIISGDAVTNKKYSPDEQVIIYIPYNNITGFGIINQKSFEFDNKLLQHLFQLFILLLPAISFFSVWYFFGRENSKGDVPERLSMYPNSRKASEVAVFFNPPFSSSNQNLLPTLLTDFYNNKIIDIKTKDKDLYIKINKYERNSFNEIEKDFIDLLKFFEKNSEKDGNYFLLKSSKIKWKDKNEMAKIYSSLSSSVNIQKKEFISNRGINIEVISLVLLFFISLLVLPSTTFGILSRIFIILTGVFILIFEAFTSLLKKFKKDYYLEYRQWQSFKKFLKDSPSMKLHGHKGTIVWGEFLVYATALGAASKVLKEMKDQKIITENQYNTYFIISSPSNLSSHTGGFSSGSGSGGGIGGGFGGVGGGGVGGGGGGGR